MKTDETQPLLSPPENERRDPHVKDTTDTVVDFDPNGDSDNPMDWPPLYKWSIVVLLAISAFTVTFNCISVVPVANRIIADLKDREPSKSSSVLLVTIWELGEAAGPLVVAPLSEKLGRYPVINVANLLFVVATAMGALSQSTEVLIAARFLTGLAVTSNVLNPAIVGDMFKPEERGSPMSVMMFAPLLGGAIGPAISGAIAENFSWRTVLWISVALGSGCEIVFFTYFRETFKVPIIARKAARLRKETGRTDIKSVFDAGISGETVSVLESMLRPAIVLAGSGVLQALTIFGSLVYTYFYIMATSLPDILEDIYHLSPTLTGLAFISFSVGAAISVFTCNLALDRIYIRLRESNHGQGKPEYRLPLCIIGGFALPIVVTLYGWAAQLRAPLFVELLLVAFLGMTLLLGFLPLMSYIVDAFGLYSASAMTALIVTRCLMGTFLPLAIGPLVDRLDWGWGITVFAAASLCMAPITIFVMRYGSKWRQRSKYSREE